MSADPSRGDTDFRGPPVEVVPRVARGAAVKASGDVLARASTATVLKGRKKHTAWRRHYGDALLAEVPGALLLSYPWGVQVMLCSHDGVMNGQTAHEIIAVAC